MSKTHEGNVKSRVDAIVTRYSDVIVNPMTMGYGKSGVSDKLICIYGQFVAIETKTQFAKSDKKFPTKLQQRFLANVLRNGGAIAVVNETNIDQLDYWLRMLQHGDTTREFLFEGCPHPYNGEIAQSVEL